MLVASGACTEAPDSAPEQRAAPQATSTPQTVPVPAAPAQAAQVASAHLQIAGSQFRTSDGRTWPWRGITSFRLLEQLAAGRTDEVERYLAWAAAEKLSIVRVLAMAKHLFELSPDRGRAHLDDLLTRAARHNLHVEIVALADTGSYDVAAADQVSAIAAIAARHPNAVLEIANEPYHATQRPEVHERKQLAAWLSLVPGAVPVATGADDTFDDSSDGEFVTYHFSRSSGQQGWGHVLALAEGHAVRERLRKPLINDEPIGAGQTYQPGRRDDNPDRMRAAALLTRMTGMGGTFHYEGGLQSRIPEAVELACFKAWQEAWVHLPDDIESQWTFRPAGANGSVATVSGAAGAWEVQKRNEVWLLIVGAPSSPKVQWASGWREERPITWSDSQLRRAVRTGP